MFLSIVSEDVNCSSTFWANVKTYMFVSNIKYVFDNICRINCSVSLDFSMQWKIQHPSYSRGILIKLNKWGTPKKKSWSFKERTLAKFYKTCTFNCCLTAKISTSSYTYHHVTGLYHWIAMVLHYVTRAWFTQSQSKALYIYSFSATDND